MEGRGIQKVRKTWIRDEDGESERERERKREREICLGLRVVSTCRFFFFGVLSVLCHFQ